MLSAVCGLIGWEDPVGQMRRLAHSHVKAVLGSIHPLQLLKVFPSITDIDESGCRCWENRNMDFFLNYADSVSWLYIRCRETLSSLLTNGRVRHDDHDICVRGKDVNEGRKVGVPHFHALERGCELTGKRKVFFFLNQKHHKDSAGDVWSDSDVFCTYLQLSLNCLIMLLIFSNRWASRCSLHW